MDNVRGTVIGAGLIGSLLVFTGIVLLIRNLATTRGWKRVDAIIVAAEKTYSESYDTWYYAPVAEYVPAGSSARLRVTGTIRSNMESFVRVGGRASVLYDPAQPENALIATLMQRHFVPLVFGFIGILVAGIGVLIAIAL